MSLSEKGFLCYFKHNGGLDVLSFETLDNSFKMNWLINLIKQEDNIWNTFPKHLLNIVCGIICLYVIIKTKSFLLNCPIFMNKLCWPGKLFLSITFQTIFISESMKTCILKISPYFVRNGLTMDLYWLINSLMIKGSYSIIINSWQHFSYQQQLKALQLFCFWVCYNSLRALKGKFQLKKPSIVEFLFLSYHKGKLLKKIFEANWYKAWFPSEKLPKQLGRRGFI